MLDCCVCYLAWIYLLVTIFFHFWLHFGYEVLWHCGYCTLTSWSSSCQKTLLRDLHTEINICTGLVSDFQTLRECLSVATNCCNQLVTKPGILPCPQMFREGVCLVQGCDFLCRFLYIFLKLVLDIICGNCWRETKNRELGKCSIFLS